MKTYIVEIDDEVLLSIDSETPEERRLLHRFTKNGGYTTAGGTDIDGGERVQFITAGINLTLKGDIANLISYADGNNQMTDEDRQDLAQIRARLKEIGLFL